MDLITSGEVMEILRISKSTLHRWISNGKLKTYRTGKKLKFNYKEVMEVIEEYNPALKNISTNVKHRRHPEDSFTNEEAVIDSSGHELRVFKDHQTEKKTADEYRVMERCPTSNEQTLAVKQFDKEHYPFDKYDKEGIVVKINTDDPGVCNVALTSESERVMGLYDDNPEKMESLNLRALDTTFISDEKKKELREKLLKNYDEINQHLKRQLDIREKKEDRIKKIKSLKGKYSNCGVSTEAYIKRKEEDIEMEEKYEKEHNF